MVMDLLLHLPAKNDNDQQLSSKGGIHHWLAILFAFLYTARSSQAKGTETQRQERDTRRWERHKKTREEGNMEKKEVQDQTKMGKGKE